MSRPTDDLVSTFPGDGEMARLMRSHDWATTPLGPPETWSEAFKTAVRICVESRFPMAIWWGEPGTQLYNDGYLPLLGAKHPEALGQSCKECWAEIWDVVGPLYDQVMSGHGPTWSNDLLLLMQRYGFEEETYFTFSYSSIRGEDGEVAGLLVTCAETTEHVVGERRLRLLRGLGERAAAAREPEEAAETIVESLAGDPADVPFSLLYLLDDPGSPRLAACAPAGIERLCWSLGDALGGGARLVQPTAGALDPRLCAQGALAVPLRRPGTSDLAGLLFAGISSRRPLDGGYRDFVDLLAEQAAALLASARAREEEHRRAESLAELDRAKTLFFSNVSHEFRTPLTLMVGPLEGLLEGPEVEADPQLREEIAVIHRNGLRLLKLVNTLLDFSRLEVGRVEASFEPVDLAALTADLASVFRAAVERAGLRLEIDCAPLREPVYVDRDMWEKIVLNLLSNALKFTLQGRIALSLAEEDGTAALRVRDTGSGIRAEELPRLFERFHRVSGAWGRSAEGSGIGLALVRELVVLHGGTIVAESALEEGSTFTVRIPLGLAHLPADRLAPASRVGVAGAEPFVQEALRWLPDQQGEGRSPAPVPGRLGRVLVADDNADMREYLERLLTPRYAVAAVADGHEALLQALADPPDLVLSDAMMPRVDGLDLVKALRSDPRTSAIPVVLLSARAGEEAAAEGLERGADDYLVKPFSARDLLARVGAHLELGQSRRQAEDRFRFMADSIPALVWVAGSDRRAIFLNRGWSEFTGRPITHDLGEGWLEAVHPDDRPALLEGYRRAVVAGEPFEMEYRLLRHDGVYRWVLDRGVALGDDETFGGYVGGCVDVHDRRQELDRQALLAEVSLELDTETGVGERLRRLTRLVVDRGAADLASISQPNADEALWRRFVAATDPQAEATCARLGEESPIVLEVYRSGKPVLLTDEIDAAIEASSPDPEQVELRRSLSPRSAIVVPLVARGSVLGVLALTRTGTGERYDADDLALVGEIGRRAGLAVDNARLFEQEQDTARRLALLQEATAELSAAATSDAVAQVVARQATRLLEATACTVFELRDEAALVLVAEEGMSKAGRGQRATFSVDDRMPAGTAVREGASVWLPMGGDWDERYPDFAEGFDERGVAEVAALPLVAAGRCLGAIRIVLPEGRSSTPEDRVAAEALAHQGALAMERALLLRDEAEGRRTAERLASVAGALSRSLALEEVGQVIVSQGTAALGADAGMAVLKREGHLEAIAVEGYPAEEFERRFRRIPLDARIPVAEVMRSGEPLWLESPESWTNQGFDPPTLPLPTAVVAPLVAGGVTIGAIGFRFSAEVHRFSAQERTFVATLASQCAQAIERARLYQAEHEVAGTLQRALLPAEVPRLGRLDLAVRYLPGTEGTEAGGDWYDVLALEGNRIGLVVGDVVGRGPAAAAVMGQLRSALAAFLLEGPSPGEALARLNRFSRRVPGALATTVACLVLDLEGQSLRFSCAGHPYPALLEPTGLRFLEGARGVPLGVSDIDRYPEAETTVEPGSSIILFSDGLVERRTEGIDTGFDRLRRVVEGAAAASTDSLADGVLAGMLEGAPTSDDVALVVARLLPASLVLRRPADPAELAGLRQAVREWAAAAAIPVDVTADLLLAVGEATANAVEHAYRDSSGMIETEVRRDGDGVQVKVRDFGSWRAARPHERNRGRGISLMRAVAEQVSVNGGEEGTEVRLRVPIPSPGRSAEPQIPTPPDAVAAAYGERRLALTGELDGEATRAIRAEILGLVASEGQVVIDLTAVSYLGSAGIALLVEAAELAGRHGAALQTCVAAATVVQRVLSLSGLEHALGVREVPGGVVRAGRG